MGAQEDYDDLMDKFERMVKGGMKPEDAEHSLNIAMESLGHKKLITWTDAEPEGGKSKDEPKVVGLFRSSEGGGKSGQYAS